MLDITRTTGTSTGKRRSMNEVVMPAATEITSWEVLTRPAISSSILPMSCGLTPMTSTDALFAASAAEMTGTP